MLDGQLWQITQINLELEIVDQHLVEIARNDTRVRLLMTLPGMSHVVAVGLLTAIGDIECSCMPISASLGKIAVPVQVVSVLKSEFFERQMCTFACSKWTFYCN